MWTKSAYNQPTFYALLVRGLEVSKASHNFPLYSELDNKLVLGPLLDLNWIVLQLGKITCTTTTTINIFHGTEERWDNQL